MVRSMLNTSNIMPRLLSLPPLLICERCVDDTSSPREPTLLFPLLLNLTRKESTWLESSQRKPTRQSEHQVA